MTPAQLAALFPKVFADPGAAALISARDVAGLTAYLNADSGSLGWRSDAPVNAILDAINWTGYTPQDTIQNSDTDPTLSIRVGRLLTIQTKQMNLQLMLQGRDVLDCRRPNVRGGLRDAVTQVPSGATGAMTSPGGSSGANVLAQCVRNLTNAELMLAANSQASDSTGSTSARVPTFEGRVEPYEVTGLLFNADGSPRNP